MSCIARHASSSPSAGSRRTRAAPSATRRAPSDSSGHSFVAHEPGANPYVDVYAVLDHFAFGHALEEESGAGTCGIDARKGGILPLRWQRAVEFLPGGETRRWRRHHVPQHFAPEASDALRFCAVDSDLDLLDRRHGPTVQRRADPAIARDPGCGPLRRACPRTVRKTDNRQAHGTILAVGARARVVPSSLRRAALAEDRYTRSGEVVAVARSSCHGHDERKGGAVDERPFSASEGAVGRFET